MHNVEVIQRVAGRRKINKYHFRIVVTAGMGFFTDAYDLFIIGIVTAILSPIWHLTTSELALLNGAALAAAAIGAVFFGTLSDKFGRKKLYGVEVVILFLGAILSALSPSYIWLLLSRVLVGFGIGGDYPTSAVVASEHSPKQYRGFLVLLVFAMQAVGLIIGPLLASLLLMTHLPHHIVWRVLLGLGAIPAASVFYLRRRIKESPHYLLSKQSPLEVSRVIHDLAEAEGEEQEEIKGYKAQSLLSKKWLIYLIGTAGAWFLLDVALYGNGISSVLIIQHLSPHTDLLNHTLISAAIFLVFAVPGYYFAAKYVDRIGRKPLQYLGFAMIAVCYALLASIAHIEQMLVPFVLIFGVSFFFVNFGPNTTTFLIPSEIFPTSIRAKGHGFSAAIGKCGAFVGALFVPIFLKAYGMHLVMLVMAIVCIAGVLITMLLPEMKNISLSETEVKQ